MTFELHGWFKRICKTACMMLIPRRRRWSWWHWFLIVLLIAAGWFYIFLPPLGFLQFSFTRMFIFNKLIPCHLRFYLDFQAYRACLSFAGPTILFFQENAGSILSLCSICLYYVLWRFLIFCCILDSLEKSIRINFLKTFTLVFCRYCSPSWNGSHYATTSTVQCLHAFLPGVSTCLRSVCLLVELLCNIHCNILYLVQLLKFVPCGS